MTNSLRVPALLGMLIMALMGTNAMAGDAAAGKNKSVACAGCHGLDGNSMVPSFPKLAGQGGKYTAKQIMDFKAGEKRTDPVMAGMVAALSQEDAEDIGAYYESQKLKDSAPHDTAKLALGKEIYKGGNMQTGVPACQACHGPDGAGVSPSGYPQLGGQYTDYTIKQLNAFKDGTRSNDAGELMRKIMVKMTNEEIEAVAHYIASLK